MKTETDLMKLWLRYLSASEKIQLTPNGKKNENPAQVGAATRAYGKFQDELCKQRNLESIECFKVINEEFMSVELK